MADLKTTNIFGDAYINNKVGIATNAPATRLQIGQLSPTAATEGLQFGDDSGTRIYRSSAGTLTLSGSVAGLTLSASTALYGNYGDWSGESNKIQWHSNNLYLVNRGGGSWLFRNSSAANVFEVASNGSTSAATNINAGTYVYAGTYLQTNGNLIYPSGYAATQRLEVGNASGNAWIDGLTIAQGGNVTVYNNLTTPSATISGYITFPNDTSSAGLINTAGTAWLKLDDTYGNMYIVNNQAGAGIYFDSNAYYWRAANGSTSLMSLSGNGDLGAARYLTGTYVNTSDDTSSATVSYIIAKFGDNYHRSAPAAKVAAFLSGQTMNIAGSSTSCTGNAATATTLQTARNIGGVSFNGSADINLPGVNTAGNQNTSGNAATATNSTQLGGVVAARYVRNDTDGTAGDLYSLVTVTKSLTVTTSWLDTGISAGSDLVSGAYILTLNVDNYAVSGGHYNETYTGIMYWYAGSTNSTDYDEIPLHKSGHAPNTRYINLRTLRGVSGVLKLQIISSVTTSGASNYVFKFRRII